MRNPAQNAFRVHSLQLDGLFFLKRDRARRSAFQFFFDHFGSDKSRSTMSAKLLRHHLSCSTWQGFSTLFACTRIHSVLKRFATALSHFVSALDGLAIGAVLPHSLDQPGACGMSYALSIFPQVRKRTWKNVLKRFFAGSRRLNAPGLIWVKKTGAKKKMMRC